jgi:hypothetical protein
MGEYQPGDKVAVIEPGNTVHWWATVISEANQPDHYHVRTWAGCEGVYHADDLEPMPEDLATKYTEKGACQALGKVYSLIIEMGRKAGGATMKPPPDRYPPQCGTPSTIASAGRAR